MKYFIAKIQNIFTPQKLFLTLHNIKIIKQMKILVTGAAGFIGSYVTKRLAVNNVVVGIDNINDYYDPVLKYYRLKTAGFIPTECEKWNNKVKSSDFKDFSFIRMDISDDESVNELFNSENFDYVINLAAQAGVRYSIQNPKAYIKSNVDGFMNILEGCRNTGVKHLVYASSSSVYGLNGKVPFSEHDAVCHPASLYAATKISNEMMAHTYSRLYGIPTTGLRFFTVYGPAGRPDMSPFLFADAILRDKPIKVFNNGDMLRDFTFIEDIVECVVRIVEVVPKKNPEWNNISADPASSDAPYKIYNIGNSQPTKLKDYITMIEQAAGKEAIKELLPMQPGDVYQTYADCSALEKVIGFKPNTKLSEGIKLTVKWFRSYYKL